MKDLSDIEILTSLIDIVEKSNIKYLIEGGWGVDILSGSQTRKHRDLDIDVDVNNYEQLIADFKSSGFKITTNELPVRIELHHSKLGFIDIHPIIFKEDGSAIQVIPEYGDIIYKKEWIITKEFCGRSYVCLALEAQKLFHTGYELREVDKHDLLILEKIDCDN